MSQTLKLFQFKWNNVCPTIAIIGKRGTGKTTLIKDLLKNLCTNDKISTIYMDSKTCDQKILKGPSQRLENQEILVLDDCVCVLRDLSIHFMNSRQYNRILIATFGHPMELRPAGRVNADYVFVFKESSLEYLYSNYFNSFESFEEFKEVFEEKTKDYGCLVLETQTGSVFYYRAPKSD